jgi:hypothetical protein
VPTTKTKDAVSHENLPQHAFYNSESIQRFALLI